MKADKYTGWLVLFLMSCIFALPYSVAAQARPTSQKQLDIAAARAERKAAVGQNMYLTPSEAKRFWPVYDDYEAGMDRIEDRHIREIKNYVKKYRTLTDDDAREKLEEVISIQQARLDLQKAYVPKFNAVVSPIKVTRFYQIDNKLRAMVQCSVAQMVPLAQPPPVPRGGDRDL